MTTWLNQYIYAWLRLAIVWVNSLITHDIYIYICIYLILPIST